MSTPDYIRRSQNNYNAKFDIIQIKAPKGTKERITTLSGQSMAAFCLQCVLDRLDELERSETAPEHEQPANTPTDSENVNATITEAQAEKKQLTDDDVMEIWRQRVAENEAKKKAAANEMLPEPEPVQEEEPEDAKAVFLRELERIRAGQIPEENPEKEAARTASKKQEESEEK
jgi:hypothetical protein